MKRVFLFITIPFDRRGCSYSSSRVMAAPADREGHPATPCESTSSDWERASEWLTAICVVTFDLELGQALEVRQGDH